MPYIGTSPSQGVRRVHTYTATANQTSFSGAGAEGATLSYKDSNFVDVYQNGVKLGDADYTATSGTAIVLGTGATVSDLVVIVAYDVFSAADTVSKADGGQFDGAVTFAANIDATASGVTTATNAFTCAGGGTFSGPFNTISTNGELRFRDDAIKIQSSADGQLDIDADTEIEITTTTVDLNGALTISGDTTLEDGADLITASAGTSNVRIGVNAGNSITSGGNYNVTVGDEAGTALTTGDNNVAVGFEALTTEDANGSNTAVGFRALKTLNAGTDSYNTAVGHNAGLSVTTGVQNVIIGAQAGDALTDADHNVAVGPYALTSDTQGSKSTAVGWGTLVYQNFSSATDSYNTAVGYNAGTNITTGQYNTLIGGLTGDALTDADKNVAVGSVALSTDTQGSKSTAVGYGSLSTQNFSSATDSHNTAVGHASGSVLTTGIENTLIGSLAGDALTDADFNVAIGVESLGTDTKGNKTVAIGGGALNAQNFTSSTDTHNVAVGFHAGNDVTTGIKNTMIGNLSGDKLTDADLNTAVGYGALSEDIKGDKSTAIGAFALEAQAFTSVTSTFNVAVGYQCLTSSTTATHNTAVGFQAGLTVSTGHSNTLIGQGAGQDITDGLYNTCLGFQTMTHDRNTNGNRNVVIGAFADTSSTDSDNQIILGYNVIGTADNNFTFGKDGDDSNIAFGATSISAPSDERYKEEITTSTAGLSFINDLRPVTFKWKKEKDIPSDHRAYVADSDTRVMGRGEKIQHGFVAQEVKAVIDNHSEVKDGFEMWCTDSNDGRQRLAPSELIPMLVKAIQELSAEVTALKGE
jgi:hypothetical protein